jgi:hypothetical protein
MTTDDDDPMVRLGKLPSPDVDPLVAERIRARAHAALVGRADPTAPPWRERAALLWARALPAAVAGTSAAYLTWALLTVASLFD